MHQLLPFYRIIGLQPERCVPPEKEGKAPGFIELKPVEVAGQKSEFCDIVL
jgi:hypothetical protein